MVIEDVELDFQFDFEQQTKLDAKSLKGKDINYIVLLAQHNNFKCETPSHLIGLMGKPMVSYVKKVCESKPKTIELNETDDTIKTIKPHLTNSEWTVVLYSDTPLLTYKTLAEAFRYAEMNEINVVKLPRGYILKTEYIKRVNEIYAPIVLFENHEDFLVAEDFMSLSKISEIMKNRILSNFMKSGVQIIDPASTYIESLVSIGENSIIYPNACIMGDSHIGESCTIGYGSTVKNSVIGDKSNIQNSMVLSSVIMDSCLVEQSTIEKNSLVEKNSVVKHYSIVSSSKIGENSFVCWARIKGVELEPNTKLEN